MRAQPFREPLHMQQPPLLSSTCLSPITGTTLSCSPLRNEKGPDDKCQMSPAMWTLHNIKSLWVQRGNQGTDRLRMRQLIWKRHMLDQKCLRFYKVHRQKVFQATNCTVLLQDIEYIQSKHSKVNLQ